MRKMPEIAKMLQLREVKTGWRGLRGGGGGKNICTIYIFTFLPLPPLLSHMQMSVRFVLLHSYPQDTFRASRIFQDQGQPTHKRLASCHMQHDIMIVIVRLSASLSLTLPVSLSLSLSINSPRVTGCPVAWRVNLTSATKYLHRNCFVSSDIFYFSAHWIPYRAFLS